MTEDTQHEESLFGIYAPHWSYCEEGEFCSIGNRHYLYRIPGAAEPKRCVIRYEDDNIVLFVFCGKNDKHLGFGVWVRREGGFAIIEHQHWLMFADRDSNSHTMRKTVDYAIDHPAIRMAVASTDGTVGKSYWVSVKRKETFL